MGQIPRSTERISSFLITLLQKRFQEMLLRVILAQLILQKMLYASVSGRLCSPDPRLGLCPWTPLGDFRPQTLCVCIEPPASKIIPLNTSSCFQ